MFSDNAQENFWKQSQKVPFVVLTFLFSSLKPATNYKLAYKNINYRKFRGIFEKQKEKVCITANLCILAGRLRLEL